MQEFARRLLKARIRRAVLYGQDEASVSRMRDLLEDKNGDRKMPTFRASRLHRI